MTAFERYHGRSPPAKALLLCKQNKNIRKILSVLHIDVKKFSCKIKI